MMHAAISPILVPNSYHVTQRIKYIRRSYHRIIVKSGSIDVAIGEGRVKLHRFLPSGRVVWTVVGRNDEYWLDPDSQYCSCQKFYYSLGSPCHHLMYQREAAKISKYQSVVFDDAEFAGFMSGLVESMLK